MLRDQYRITHTTLQVDHPGDDLLQIGGRASTTDAHYADPHGVVHRGEHAH